MRLQTLAMLGLLILCLKASAQDNKRLHSLGFSLLNEHAALPFTKPAGGRLHPGVAVEFGSRRDRNGIYQFTHLFQLGYYHHKGFHQAFFLAWKGKFEWRILPAFDLHLLPGMGYGHSFPTDPTYQFDNGVYSQKGYWGSPHLMPSLGLGTGLHLDAFWDVPLALQLRYEAFSLAPYAPKGIVPLTLGTLWSVGITLPLPKH